jgi:hypothetical protein
VTVPTVKDRVVQAALKLVLEPIFEREFLATSYGFRPDRGCKDALREVDRLLKAGYTYVVDADFRGYFDSIPHGPLLNLVGERIADGRIVALVESFLQQRIMDGMESWTPISGSPQGAVLTPRTQWVTGEAICGVRASCRPRPTDGDGVLNQYRALSDQDLFDEKPHHVLTLKDVQGPSGRTEALPESTNAVGDLEERRLIDLLGFQGTLFRLESRLPRSQLAQAGTQFVQREEIFLIGIDELPGTRVHTLQLLADGLAAPAGWAQTTAAGETTVDLFLDQFGVFQRLHDMLPDESVR